MCGRAAQTNHAVHAAAEALGVPDNSGTAHRAQNAAAASPHQAEETIHDSHGYPVNDNYNMSPGMDATVFYINRQTGHLEMDRKVWGLVSRGGTRSTPLPQGMNKHFSNLMFNARSDTLYQKPTFARLASAGKTCIIALDGFFEWKTELGKKQPYFVYRRPQESSTGENTTEEDTPTQQQQRPYLLMAGLWTSVPTGRADDPTLDTFAILTTDACPSLQWLHGRMPVCIWDDQLARQWLERPTERVHQEMELAASRTPEDCFKWHAVSSEMSSTKFRSKNAIKALPPMKTVKSYFAVKASPTTAYSARHGNDGAGVLLDSPYKATAKREAPSSPSVSTASSPQKKPKVSKSTKPDKPKKGTILAFFSPKAKKT